MEIKIPIIVFLSLFVFSMGVLWFSANSQNETLKDAIRYDVKFTDALEEKWTADEFYSDASLNYEYHNYAEGIQSCEKARDHYSSYGQEIRELKAEVDKNKKPIFNSFSLMLGKAVEISNNMYEACEHFESAMRQYEIYYDEATPYGDPSYEMGGKAIENQNEKIKAHDKAVEEYNTYLAEYQTDLERYVG